MQILTIIPARGGSKRIKRKNLLPVAGKPLVAHAVDNAKQANAYLTDTGLELKIVVSTDDPQIEAVVDCETVRRGSLTARDAATIGDVVHEVVDQFEWGGPVMVLQPTSIVHPKSIANILRYWMREGTEKYIATIGERPGLFWTVDEKGDDVPLFDQRVNTQQQAVSVYEENGAVRIFGRNEGDYNRTPDDLYEIDLVDIDTWGDLQQVRSIHEQGRIHFEISATNQLGSGHLYRCLALADELQHHRVTFGFWEAEDWAIDFVHDHGYSWEDNMAGEEIDVHVCDHLDTSVSHIARLRAAGRKVITIEDRGPGAQLADLVINAMYPGTAPHEVDGPKWAVIRPEFLARPWEYRPEGNRVLLLFGGTDPKDLTFQVATALGRSNLDVAVMTGPGYNGAYDGSRWTGSVAAAMRSADLLVTSGGRTVFEAAAIGVPTVVIAQNLREVTHTHVGERAGNIYLGLADAVSATQVFDTVASLMNFPEPRMEMSARSRGLVDGKGVRRIVRRIEDVMEGL